MLLQLVARLSVASTIDPQYAMNLTVTQTPRALRIVLAARHSLADALIILLVEGNEAIPLQC